MTTYNLVNFNDVFPGSTVQVYSLYTRTFGVSVGAVV